MDNPVDPMAVIEALKARIAEDALEIAILKARLALASTESTETSKEEN